MIITLPKHPAHRTAHSRDTIFISLTVVHGGFLVGSRDKWQLEQGGIIVHL